MEEIALKLKSHSTRLEACKEIIAQMKQGNMKAEQRDAIIEILKEPWVEQHDTTARLTWYALLSQFPYYLKKHGDTLVKDVAPFIYNLYTQRQLPLYRTPAVSIIVEVISKLTNECKWKNSDIDSKIIYIYLKNVIDKNSPQYDVVASTRIGICLLQNGLTDLVAKYYGDRVQRVLDLILNEKLLKDLIRESILRFSCDPLFKDIFIALSQLEKQNDTSKKMWKEYLQLGNSGNTVYRSLFYEILTSFIAKNQNRKIFVKILKTKAMVQLTKNLDTMTSESPYFSGLIARLSSELAKLNENPRFRKLIFPPIEDYKPELADVSKMVIFATGASEKIFDFIADLPKPFPEAFLLNINNVEISNISQEFLNAFFSFSFVRNDNMLINIDISDTEEDDSKEDEEAFDDDIAAEDDEDDDEAGPLLSDLLADQDEIIEKAQALLLDTIGRCATWHTAPKLSKLIDFYEIKAKLDEDEEGALQVVFSEDESRLRNDLFEIRKNLLTLEKEGLDEDKRQAFTFLIESILLHQLYIPSLLTEDASVVIDLQECVDSFFVGQKERSEDAPNPIEVLLDIVLKLISISPKLTASAGYCLKYFMKQNINEEIVDMITSVIQPALTGQDNAEVFESTENGVEMMDEMSDEEMEESSQFTEMTDKIDATEEDDIEEAADTTTTAMEMVNLEEIDGFDQDEYMFKQDEVLKQMFLIRKRELDRQKSLTTENNEIAYNSAVSSLQLIESFIRHTYSANDVMRFFMKLLKMYMSKLQKGQPKKHSAMTHQKILHVLSIIYKTPCVLNVNVEDRKKEKNVTHKYYGRFDDLIPGIVKIFFEFIEVSNKLPPQQAQPILQFFREIFITYPNKETLITPLVKEILRKRIMSTTKFSSPKAIAFLVSIPWMAESCGGLLPPLLKKFSKRGAEVYRFVQSCLDKKWDLFAIEGTFDEFISETLERLQADMEERREKMIKIIKKIIDPVRSVLRRTFNNTNRMLNEETKKKMIQIATLLNDVKSSNWAPLLEKPESKRKRKQREEDSESIEKPMKRAKFEASE